MSTPSNQLRYMVYSSLMAALIAAGGFIAIPLGPVPMTLQTLFVLLAGLLLGMKWGTACVSIYLLAGGLGFPVFSGGRGGFAHFAGPTGGYLVGFLIAVFLVGFITDAANKNNQNQSGNRMLLDLVAAFLGTIMIFAVGVPWLKVVTKMPWEKAIAAGVLPFLIGAVVKMVAAVFIAKAVRSYLNRSLVTTDNSPV